jgi:DNA-binding XRE family transcriptional regulator
MDDAQMTVLRQEVADTYRKKNDLLTSGEIISYRKKLGLSQREFASYLEVGEASVKRWETSFIQDKSQDSHIRLKCDRELAEENAFELSTRISSGTDLHGNRTFSWERFESAVLMLVKTFDSPLFLNKALFYVDFLNFKRHEVSVTGCVYARLDYGPCPDSFRTFFRKMLRDGSITEGAEHKLIPKRAPNMNLFDDNERATIQAVIEIASQAKGAQKLYELSHEEAAFEKTDLYKQISYQHAAKLKIS